MDALELAAAFSRAALDGGMTCAFGFESDFLASTFLAGADLELLPVSLPFLVAVLPREDVDELDEYELSEPESLESDEPEPDELDRRRRLSVVVLRGTGEAFFRLVETAFSMARLSTGGDGFRFLVTTGDTFRAGEYLFRRGLEVGDRVRITFRTCVAAWRSLSFDRWLS